jgi:hypothetical protein
MAAADPHNKAGVIVAKLFFDMSHLRVGAGSMPKFRPPYFAGKPRRFACEQHANIWLRTM